jgi:hypothetical protein
MNQTLKNIFEVMDLALCNDVNLDHCNLHDGPFRGNALPGGMAFAYGSKRQ